MHSVLVVDDSVYVVDVFMTMLEQGGYRTFAAYSGPECLELLRTMTPDLVLLDVMMKPMDGWKTLEEIRGNPATKNIPVLMLTSKVLTHGEAEKYSSLIEDYVLKPLTNFELYDVVEHVLRRRQMILADVERARQAGLDNEIVSEYALLSKNIEVSRRFLTILENTYNLNKQVVPISDNIGTAMKNLETHLRSQEARHRQIKEEIKKASREVVLTYQLR